MLIRMYARFLNYVAGYFIKWGEDIAKKYVPTHTIRHYKERAEEIRKEMLNSGR